MAGVSIYAYAKDSKVAKAYDNLTMEIISEQKVKHKDETGTGEEHEKQFSPINWNTDEILNYLKIVKVILLSQFLLACTRDNKPYTDFINCIAFGEVANALCKHKDKGLLHL